MSEDDSYDNDSSHSSPIQKASLQKNAFDLRSLVTNEIHSIEDTPENQLFLVSNKKRLQK
jgi:hypothetical protein